jgi:hypothetical protein
MLWPLQAHSAALRHVIAHGITTNEPVPAANAVAGGDGVVTTRLASTGAVHAVRMLTFVEGRVMGTTVQVGAAVRCVGTACRAMTRATAACACMSPASLLLARVHRRPPNPQHRQHTPHAGLLY